MCGLRGVGLVWVVLRALEGGIVEKWTSGGGLDVWTGMDGRGEVKQTADGTFRSRLPKSPSHI